MEFFCRKCRQYYSMVLFIAWLIAFWWVICNGFKIMLPSIHYFEKRNFRNIFCFLHNFLLRVHVFRKKLSRNLRRFIIVVLSEVLRVLNLSFERFFWFQLWTYITILSSRYYYQQKGDFSLKIFCFIYSWYRNSLG